MTDDHLIDSPISSRVTFTTCTDYHTEIDLTKRDRLFACYEALGAPWTCDIQAATNTNVKDTTRRIPKH